MSHLPEAKAVGRKCGPPTVLVKTFIIKIKVHYTFSYTKHRCCLQAKIYMENKYSYLF